MNVTSTTCAPAPPAAVLFAIDNDPGTVQALYEDLTRRFGREFRIVCQSAAGAGLAALRELAEHHVPVALLIVGQELGGMTGVDFLSQAHMLHPLAVRILLVQRDYSAQSPIVQARLM